MEVSRGGYVRCGGVVLPLGVHGTFGEFQDGWELLNVNSDDYFSVQSILAQDLQHVPDSGALKIWGRTRREGGEYEYATYAAVRPGAVLPTATWHSPPPKVRRG